MDSISKKKMWEKRLPLLASFLIPLLITLIVCMDHEVFPFGEKCILHIDMYHQYCPFFTEFMNKLKDGHSLMYSWSIGLGADFVALYAYYLASPLNWFLIFCPEGFVIEFMTILVVLKIALCGFTFGYYLKKHFEKNHFAICIFASAYALSAFMATYAWNIMWTDCLVLAPLIVLGLEQLVKEGKGTLYYITLAVSILSNYYISIMICIFLALYFVILWIEQREGRIKAILNFAWYSLLAGGTAAVLLLPEIVALSESGSQNITFPETVEWYFNIVAELARHCVLTDGYTGRDHWPNIYSGVFVLLFIVLYLLNKKISWKQKVIRLLFVAFFVISFANKQLDFIWHGFHFPDSLPGRQAFLYTFLLLVICYETFIKLDGNKVWHVIVAVAFNALWLFFAYRLTDDELVGKLEFGLTAFFLLCYAVIVALWMCGNWKVKQWILLLGMLLMISEITLHFDCTGLNVTNRTTYVKDLEDYEVVLAEIEQKESAESELGAYFYRTEKFERKTKNDAALSGFYSGTQFSSLMNLNVSHIYQDLGLEGGKNFYCYNGATPLVASMLSVKYMIADNEFEANPIRELVASSGNTYLYQNKYSLPLGFVVDEYVAKTWNYSGNNPIENQNELAYLLGAEEEMLTQISASSMKGESIIKVQDDGYIFATYIKTDVDTLTEEISDGRTKSFTKVSHGYTLDLGYCHAGDTITIKNDDNEVVSITAYQLNMESLDAAYQTLAKQTMTLTECSDTIIKGNIDVTQAGRLVFSIANEKGWTLYVDGVEKEKEMFAEAFISVYLEEGIHEIELRYESPGLKEGAIISSICLLGFLVTCFCKKKLTKKVSKNE